MSSSEGTAAAIGNWVKVVDDGAPRSLLARQDGRIPDWEHAFGGAMVRYIRIDDIDHNLSAPSGGNNFVGLSGVMIFDVPEPTTAMLLVAGLVGLVGFMRRRR